VKPGDTLSKIAAAYLNDPYQFYILARYNGISVPRNLHAGQVIKVPGTAPLASQPPPSAPAGGSAQVDRLYQEGQQAARDGDKDKAYDLYAQALKAEPRDLRTRTAADQLKPELIAQHDRKAREAFRRQDLKGAIKEWDRVVELDPSNETAKLERQRAIDLEKMLNKPDQ
jgi:tetratricopeptide (TPR) repeat protein